MLPYIYVVLRCNLVIVKNIYPTWCECENMEIMYLYLAAIE